MSYRVSENFKKNTDSFFIVIRLRQVSSRELTHLLPPSSSELSAVEAGKVLKKATAGSKRG